MATSRKKQLWYLWIARDERQQHPKYPDELELHGKLHVFYDTPTLEDGKWIGARQLGGEKPSYMFPELEECCCQKFIGMIGDLGNKLPKLVEYPFSSDSYEECEKWIEEHGNDIDMCVIP